MLFHWLVTSPCGPRTFWSVAVVVSALYGRFCWPIHELDRGPFGAARWRDGSPAWKAHQIWLNFAGSVLGWWAFWCFLSSYENHQRWQTSFTVVDLVLVVIAFLGMTGYLPKVSRYGSKLLSREG